MFKYITKHTSPIDLVRNENYWTFDLTLKKYYKPILPFPLFLSEFLLL